MQTVHSIWIEPTREMCRFIEKMRIGLSPTDRTALIRALPPWYLFVFANFSPPPPRERPFWLPQHKKLSDRIMRRDRSTEHYCSPKLRMLPEHTPFTCALPGIFTGLELEQDGGTLPDLRVYNGEYPSPLPPMSEKVALRLPLSWSLNGNAPRCPSINIQQSTQIERCSIHLVKITLNSTDHRLSALYWESLAQVDLVRHPS